MNIHFVSLGCDKNLVDSEIMLGIIGREGHCIVPEPEDAAIIIINTCGFILDAADEGVKTILQMAEHKETGKCSALIVTGCMVQRYRDEIFKEMPEVDAVVGVGDYESIDRVIRDVSTGHRNVALVSDKVKDIDEGNIRKRYLSTPGHFAYLKIAEGCDNCCTYCTIPSIRGGYRSRAMESIVEEASVLAGQGVRELVLVAQDTSLYGVDIYGKSMLHVLLDRISEVDGIYWIRILYCYPEYITDELIERIVGNPKVCRYIDMPIQHASDKILKLMGRRSSSEKIREIVGKLRQSAPRISIRTTVMTGFPGETQEDFDILLQFIKEMRFDKLGVFAYSREEGTPAFDMPGQVPDGIKEKRKDMLMRTQIGISADINKGQVGGCYSVIVDGFQHERGMYCGRSDRDCYEVDGVVYFESEAELMTGDFVNVEITGSEDYDLLGRILEEQL